MREISIEEISYVSGAGIISDIFSFPGNVVIDVVKVSNDILNTALISSVGWVFDRIGLGGIHRVADTLGYAVFKTVALLGRALGGDESRITYHYESEWGG